MTPATPRPPSRGQLVGRAVLRRCPVCGSGGLFPKWFHMAERCPRCGLRFERHEGQWVGALGMNTIVSFGALLIVMVGGIVLTAPDIPMWPLTGLSVFVAVFAPLAAFPWSRTLWTAVDLIMTPVRADELDPAWAPAAAAPPKPGRPARPGAQPRHAGPPRVP